VSIHTTRGLTKSHGDLDVAQAGPSLHFNVDQKKLPPALRIVAVQAIVVLGIVRNRVGDPLGRLPVGFPPQCGTHNCFMGWGGDGPDRCT
jgi:hypothetical protein